MISAAAIITNGHAAAWRVAHDHAKTMTAAPIAPAACKSPASTASDVALIASVSTASAPNNGHGGTDQRGSSAMKNRKR